MNQKETRRGLPLAIGVGVPRPLPPLSAEREAEIQRQSAEIYRRMTGV